MKRLLALFLICGTVWAEPIGLAELIDMGLKNNPETEKSWAAVRKAQAQKGVAKSDYYPAAGVQGKLIYGRDVKYINGPVVDYVNYGADLVISYLLFDFGERRAAVHATRDALKSANWSKDYAMQHVICKVSESYYEYLNANERLQVRLRALKDTELVRDSAEELFKSGLKAEGDLSVGRGAVAQQQIELARAEAAVSIAYGKLMMNLGLGMDTRMEISSEIADYPEMKESVTDLIALAESKRADVQAKKSLLSEMHEKVSQSRRNPRPKLRLMGQGGWVEYAKHKNRGYNYSAGVILDVPLFKGFENSYRTRMALADEEITVAQLKALQEEVALEVLTYCSTVKSAQEGVKWSSLYLEESTKAYEVSMERYKSGLQNIFDLLQAQRSLDDARMNTTEAKTAWLVSLAQLAFATGSTSQ
jgi:outer membrane protein